MKERRRAARILKAVTEATLSFAPERGKEGLAHLSLRELAKSASVAPQQCKYRIEPAHRTGVVIRISGRPPIIFPLPIWKPCWAGRSFHKLHLA